MRSLIRVAMALVLLVGCADPIDLLDAGPDAGPDATVGEDAAPKDAEPDAAVDVDSGGLEDSGATDTGVNEDAGESPDTGMSPDAGGITCTPNGRQHIMFGSAQNPQTVTFGAGLPTERTVDLDGAYLASFDSGGCFEWLARIPAAQSSFGSPSLIIDPQGNIFFAVRVLNVIDFHNADDSLAWTISSSTAGPRAETYTRGVAVVSYDRTGQFRWAKRIGNAAVQPDAKGYTATTLELSGGQLRISGSANGATRGPTDDYEVIFGAGEANETRVSIGMRYQFGFLAALEPSTGELIADSVRINAPRQGATNFELRHQGRGSGQVALDGSHAQGLLYVGSAGDYDLGRGRTDQTTHRVSTNFVAGFMRYTGAGELAWHRFGGAASGGMSVFSSAMISDGSVLFSGGAPNQADFEGLAGVSTLPDGSGAYLIRYSATGEIMWLRGMSDRGLANLYVDEARGALFALSTGQASVTFGVGDPDAVTEAMNGMFVARFDLATGALQWVSKVDSASGSFRDLDILGDTLILSTRFDQVATFQPGEADELSISGVSIWSGNAAYDANTGDFLGVTEYIVHPGTLLNDGLNVGGVYEP